MKTCMNTTESGELGDAHTATPPTADPAAVQATCPADSIIDVDAAHDAAAARTTCPADSERDISYRRPSCKTNSMTRQNAVSPSQTGVPRIEHTDSIPNDSVYLLSIPTA